MDSACPICNKLEEIPIECSICSQVMEERGRVADFLGPYSADMPIESSLSCEHVFYCSRCSEIKNVTISNKFI